jgi:cbb3-type cytochrome oxidase maturation protein
MTILGFLIPAALLLGLGGLLAFLWSVKSGQYEDLDGAAARILIEDEADRIEPEEPGSNAGPKARS